MLIYRTMFGSVVYGTNVPTSDTDYKSIFLPEKRDLILERSPKVITNNTKTSQTAKNTSTDVDDEAYSLKHYLKLLAEGQTPMIDMLFAPAEYWDVYSPIIDEIWKNKEKILSKNVLPIIGYCKTQANKYGIKGSRVAAMRNVVEFLKKFPLQNTLNNIPIIHWNIGQEDELISIVQIDEKEKGMKPYLDVCGKKMPLSATVKYALSCYQQMLDAYGHRALEAEANRGIDWKALYHAIRVAREGEELLLTGNITFPRPEAPLLLQIRKGELPYKQVAELVEEGLQRVEDAAAKSTLREKPDLEWIDDFVYNTYLERVIK